MFGLSGRWTVTGPDGNPLHTVRKSFWWRTGRRDAGPGVAFTIRGSVWKREFVVAGAVGRTVLAATARISALSLHPSDFAVRRHNDGLTVPEVVALVQTWRMARRSEDATAAEGAAAGVVGTGREAVSPTVLGRRRPARWVTRSASSTSQDG